MRVEGEDDGYLTTLGFLAAEHWSRGIALIGKHIEVTGLNRAYLSAPDAARRWWEWGNVDYRKLMLLNRRLSFTVDLSRVGCGHDAALYLVEMTKPTRWAAGYCDSARAAGAAPLLLHRNTASCVCSALCACSPCACRPQILYLADSEPSYPMQSKAMISSMYMKTWRRASR